MERVIIIAITQKLVRLLVDKEYARAYQLDRDKRLPEEEIRIAIEEYKGELTYPPEEAFDDYYLYAEEENEVLVEFDLWYNGKKSDLTLSFIASLNNDQRLFSIQDIHVL